MKFIFFLTQVALVSTIYSGNQLFFETATPEDSEFLVNFAIESNNIYQTRTVSVSKAREVFDITEIIFRKGVVEVLKQNDEILGFYTLKMRPFSDDWFEYELGHLFIKKGLQGKGLGVILFKRAALVACKKGWKKLQWFSDPGAKGFYLKMGAVITGYCENILNPGADLSVFEYNLDL